MGSLDSEYATLGPLDHLPPRHYTRFVFYLPLKSGVTPNEAFNELQKGLHKTFLQLPWLNSKVYWQPSHRPGWRPGQLELRYRPMSELSPLPDQLKFVDLGPNISYAELKGQGFPMDVFSDEQLFWAPFEPNLDEGADTFVGQASFIPGGCLLSAACFHSVTDGTGVMIMLKTWADNCSRLTSQSGSPDYEAIAPPVNHFDRNMIESSWSARCCERSTGEINSASWQILGLDPVGADKSDQNPKHSQMVPTTRVLKSHIFYIPPAKFNSLKRDCAKAVTAGQISGNDATCALVWRCLVKARQATQSKASESVASEDARLEMTFEGRSSLGLPSTYLGNVVLISKTKLPVSTLASPDTSISSISQAIRNSVNELHPESVLDAYGLARGMPDYRRFDERANPIGGWELLLTSLMTMPVSTLSFGDHVFANGGKAEATRPAMDEFNKHLRICFIMPPKSHGGIEVVVGLFDEEFDYLRADKEFRKYAMPVF